MIEVRSFTHTKELVQVIELRPSGGEKSLSFEWLPGEAYALVVTHAEELLVDEEPDALNTFLRIIETVASTWASPIAEGERWDRAAVPFHCVLQARRDGESHKDLRSLDGVAPLVLDELDC